MHRVNQAPIEGNPDVAHISTSYSERVNLTMRMHNRRFTRLTNAFSKKFENHAHMVAIWSVWYNFIRIHKTLRVTPAMAAGLSQTVMDWSDIVEEMEAEAPNRDVEVRMRKAMLRHNIKTAAIILAASLAGCAEEAQKPPSREISAVEALAAENRVVDCEWAAADKFDNGHAPISSVAQQVMGVCTQQMFEARRVFGISPTDPSVDADELRQAIDNVEAARKHRLNSN